MNSAKTCKTDNEMEIIFDAVSANESLARVAVAAFVTEKNPTLEELSDIKTAVSEAVTNAIIHGYNGKEGKVRMHCKWSDKVLEVEIEDKGVGIENIKQAMEPLFTTRPDADRSGMGFSFMEAFMDEVHITSTVGRGTCVEMKKQLHLQERE